MELKFYDKYVIDYNKIVAFFDGDPAVKIGPLDDANHSCTIKVTNFEKYITMNKYMTKNFENGLKVNIEYVTLTDPFEEIKVLFNGNKHFSRAYMRGLAGDDIKVIQCMFKKEVIQYDVDDISDPRKLDSNLAENLARDLFGGLNIPFATETSEEGK